MLTGNLKIKNSSMWAITSYYNPIGYHRRLANYRLFHRYLEVPLVTVEWSPDGRFELQPGDAEILVQIGSGDVLWQKERLLNIALSHLPTECEHVAWLDCDLIFDRPGWSETGCRLLENYPLIQLFGEALHLPAYSPDADLTLEVWRREQYIYREACLAGQHLKGEAVLAIPSRGKTQGTGACAGTQRISDAGAPGMAWAARREHLETCGFYDACVLGGGDSAMALAALGERGLAQLRLRMSSPHRRHYMNWASAFYQAMRGGISYLPGRVYHLWHGDFADRQYRERFSILETMDFDPCRDLRLSDQGSWEWGAATPESRHAVED
jgi:hypothetical protein